MIDTRVLLSHLEASGASAEEAFTRIAERAGATDATWARLGPPGDIEAELEPWLGDRLGGVTRAVLWVGLSHYGEHGDFADFVNLRRLDVPVPSDRELDPSVDGLSELYDALTTDDFLSDGIYVDAVRSPSLSRWRQVHGPKAPCGHALRELYAAFAVKRALGRRLREGFVVVGSVDLNTSFLDTEYGWFWF